MSALGRLFGRFLGRQMAKVAWRAMPRLRNTMIREEASHIVAKVTRDGGKTWEAWPPEGYGTGR